jgi:hypothetical protein
MSTRSLPIGKITLVVASLLMVLTACPTVARAELSTGDKIFSDGSSIEITQIQSCPVDRPYYLSSMNDAYVFTARLSCSTKQGIEGLLNVTKITTSMISLGAACTPAGAPVVVAAGITGIASEMIELVVSNLDCDDPADTRKVDDLVKRRVCSALNQKGIDCDPERL